MRKITRILFLFLVVLVALSVGVPAYAQDDEVCVTIDGHEVCGSIADIIAILEAMNDGSVPPAQTPADAPDPVATPVTGPVLSASEYEFDFSTVNPDELYFTILGVRPSVPMAEVDYARGGFSSPWPSLSHVLAEPGKLIVDQKFPQATIDASNGAIWREDGLNNFSLNTEGPFVANCNEGGLIFISGQHGVLVFDSGPVVWYKAPDGSNAHVYIKCPNVDNMRGSDAGTNVTIYSYAAGHEAVKYFSPNPPGGFVSAEGALTALEISQKDNSSGSEGSNYTYVIGIDANTTAYTVAVWDSVDMTTLLTNWWTQ